MSAFDLRVYHVAPGRIDTLQRVLREAALPIMAEHGMRAVGFWADGDGTMLYQITEHENAGVITANWDRLHADPRWLSGLHALRGDTSAVSQMVTIVLTGIAGLPPVTCSETGR